MAGEDGGGPLGPEGEWVWAGRLVVLIAGPSAPSLEQEAKGTQGTWCLGVPQAAALPLCLLLLPPSCAGLVQAESLVVLSGRNRESLSAASHWKWRWVSISFFFPSIFYLFRAALRHMEVLRLEVESELQLPAYATATATQDP